MFNKRHLERLAGAVLLQAIGEGEGIVHFVVLENVEAAIQADFPAVVGHDVAGVDSAGAVELPGEVHAHALADSFIFSKFSFCCSPLNSSSVVTR
jgi:hypothetical protein